jgi:hypothetical protein
MNYSILPLIHYDEAVVSESGTAMIPEELFNRLFNNDDNMGIFGITIKGVDSSVAIVCMPHNDGDDLVYLPNWCILHLQSEQITIERIDIDAIPRAKTIICRVIDNELYAGDIKTALEQLLYDYKFIQSGLTLTLRVETELEGQVWIESVMDEDDIDCIGPALLGAEVILDMGEPLLSDDSPPAMPGCEPLLAEEPAPIAKQSLAEEQRRIAREARLRRFG